MAPTPDTSPGRTREFSSMAVLSYGGESTVAPAVAQADRQLAASLRALAQKQSGKEAFSAFLRKEESASYSSLTLEGDKAAFGAGAAHLNEDGGIVLDENARPELKAIHNEGASLLEITSKVHDYLLILAAGDDRKQEERFKQMREQGRRHLEGITLTQLRQEALDYILADPSFQAMFPELSQIPRSQRQKYIEAVLLRDPDLRVLYSRNLQSIHDEILKLPEIKGGEKTTQLEAQKKEKETNLEDGIARTVRVLERKYPGLITEVRIREIVNSSYSLQDAITTIETELLREKVPRADEVREYLGIGGEVKDREAKKQQIINALQGRAPAAGSLQDTEITRLNQEIDGLKNRRTALSGDATLQEQVRTYQEIQSLLRPAQGESNEFVQSLNGALVARSSIETLESQIRRLPESKDRQRSERERLAAESRILGRLERVWGETVAELMLKRYDEMTKLEQQRLAKEAEELRKKQEYEAAQDVEKVRGVIRTRWIEYNESSRSRILHQHNIGEDMRFLAYAASGEEGVRRLLLREAIGREITVIKLDENGKEIIDPLTGQPETETLPWDDVPLSRLSEHDRKILDTVYTTLGKEFKTKLFTDYYLARSCITDRTLGMRIFGRYIFEASIGELAFRQHEWELLRQNFGVDLESALKSSREAQGWLDRMKREGIVPGFKLKWLIYLLILLGLGSAIPGLGIGGAAKAAGIGVGSAAGIGALTGEAH